MRILPFIIGLSLLCLSNTTIDTTKDFALQRQPRVFIIDENELLFDELSVEYDMSLINACDSDNDRAYQKWNGMLMAMERYAKLWRYDKDIKGVKIWIKVFCNKKGYIEHIAYTIKPSSKNIDTEIFSKFLNRFIQVYRLDIRADKDFSHYGSASFPVQR